MFFETLVAMELHRQISWQLVAWDPSGARAGSAVDNRPWSSRLMVIGVADLALSRTTMSSAP
jgi:hypothetical protein